MRAVSLVLLAPILLACTSPDGELGPQGPTGDPGPIGPAGPAGNPMDFSGVDASTPWPGRLILSANATHYSLDATYCGKTASSTGAIVSGAVGGYSAAKSQCEEACNNSPTAHMCTSEEIVRTLQMELPVDSAAGWYSTGTSSDEATYVTGIVITGFPATGYATLGYTYVTDCQGWTSAAAPYSGPIWQANSAGPSFAGCTSSYPIWCCDY